MNAMLRDRDLRTVQTISATLLHPDAASPEGCARVLETTSRLLEAEQSLMLLPERGVGRLFPYGVDPKVLGTYPQELEKLDRLEPWPRHARAGAFNRLTLWYPDHDLYFASNYYNEYIAVHRFHDSVGIAIGVGGRPSASTVAKMVMTRSEGDHPEHMRRGLAIMQLVRPAFETFVRSWVARDRLRRELDRRADACLLIAADRRVLHRNPRVQEVESACPDAQALGDECMRLALELHSAMRPGAAAPPRPAVEIEIGARRYFLECTFYPEYWICAQPVVGVTIRGVPEAHPAAADLKSRFGLTDREAEVARLIVTGGLSNAGIARRLHISPHTARHHVERILGKLGISRRSQIAPRLQAAGHARRSGPRDGGGDAR